MASLSIPSQNRKGLSKLLSLPDDQIDKLVLAFQTAEISTSPLQTVTKEVASVTGFEPADVNEISAAYISLMILEAQTYWSTDKLVRALLRACSDTGFDGLIFNPEEEEVASHRLTKLLTVVPLLLSAKAVHIKFEQDSLFSSANVMTEILPVFGLSVDEEPKAAMLVHQLGIHYFGDAGHRSVYFRMDLDEIDELITLLERAKKKADSLKAFLEGSGITYIKNV